MIDELEHACDLQTTWRRGAKLRVDMEQKLRCRG